MELQKFTGVELEGVLFDGTFESTVKIVEFLTNEVNIKNGSKVSKFSIEHQRFNDNEFGATMTFTVLPMKGNPNDKSREFTLRHNDLLVLVGRRLDVIKSGMLSRYWEAEPELIMPE